MPDVKLGDFTFQYDESRSEMYVVKGEEAAAMIEVVTREQWEDFRREAKRAEEHEPEVTVELKSVQLTDHEVEENAWSVVVSGTWGDVTVVTSTSRAYVRAMADFVHETLKIVLGEDHVTLEAS